MSVVGKSMRQMLRTPLRTLLFWALIILSAVLFTCGAGLYLIYARNIQRMESVFTTVGTVEQRQEGLQTIYQWDAEKQTYWTHVRPEFGARIPVETLYFEGAPYIHAPVQRPFYGAYLPDYIMSKDDVAAREFDIRFPILELQPVEDCVPSGPVRMRVKRVLFGRIGYVSEIWFCDHDNPEPKPMYADKTYVVSLQSVPPHEGYSEEYKPTNLVLSRQYNADGERIPDNSGIDPDRPWSEATEGFYSTKEGQRWLELIKAFEIHKRTIPVEPADSTELLMSFYNKNAHIVEGRDISDEEYEQGQRVCLIRKGFADLNDISVGDQLPLSLYYANYRVSSSQVFSPRGGGWIEEQLNAQGRRFEPFEEGLYTVVGIYEEAIMKMFSAGYDMGRHAVVIPAASIQGSDANNIRGYGPMRGYNTSFQIPNGAIDAFMAAWNAQGVDGLDITFYDRGYTQLKAGFDKVRGIALALLVAGIVIVVLILLFFCHLFIGKQKKRTAIERSLGMSKKQCAISLLSGILIIALAGGAVGSAAGYFLTGGATERLVDQSKEDAYDTSFSSWVNTGDNKAAFETDTQKSSPLLCVGVGAFILLASACIATVYVRGNLKIEPLILLSTREV